MISLEVAAADFGPFGDHIYLNAANQGPMPRAVADMMSDVVATKLHPWRIDSTLFLEVPRRLRDRLAALVNSSPDEIVLGNSTSYGLQLLASAFPWRPGDEVLVVEGDYPACIYPWLPLRKQEVQVRSLKPSGPILVAEDVERELRPNTRLFCTTWVHTFKGHAVDLEAVGAACRRNGTLFAVNGAQAVGVRALDVSALPIDAVTSCGFKWLCGPYGTGFCWIRPDVIERLDYDVDYWYFMKSDEDGASGSGARYSVRKDLQYSPREDLGRTARFDVFNHGNFFNFIPWTACIDYVLERGVDRIQRHVDAFVTRLTEGVIEAGYRLVSPQTIPSRSTLVVFEAESPARTEEIFAGLKAAGVDGTIRSGRIRLSPYLHNTDTDIAQAIDVLQKLR